MDYLYKTYILSNEDARSNHLLMAKNPICTIGTVVAYLILNLVLLPRFMKNRPAYDLKTVLRLYNLFQIVINSLIVTKMVRAWYDFNMTVTGCHDVIRSTDTAHMNLVWWMWLYYFTRVIDLTETSFFYLRKKNDQASFLHYYHHVALVLTLWIGLRLTPGGSVSYHVALNSFVHVLMYSYYFMAAEVGPKSRSKLQKFKKALTTFQMIQFVFMLIHAGRLYMPDCKFSRVYLFFHSSNIFINLLLFRQFYNKSYTKKQNVN